MASIWADPYLESSLEQAVKLTGLSGQPTAMDRLTLLSRWVGEWQLQVLMAKLARIGPDLNNFSSTNGGALMINTIREYGFATIMRPSPTTILPPAVFLPSSLTYQSPKKCGICVVGRSQRIAIHGYLLFNAPYDIHEVG